MEGKNRPADGSDPQRCSESETVAWSESAPGDDTLPADSEATLDSSASFEAATGPARSAAKTIGPYRLVRKLGEGGMGQVWLADQSEPVHRTVALKLIRVGLYDDDIVQRFRTERQSLAMMDHPAIAKVFDAGATPDGQPYFVMEYVQGVPITTYCDERRLTIRQRLELFIKVCEGVQHAHQKAIIHRDLKPANILVAEMDGKPVPRIIDFGLAKTAAPPADGATLFTQVGAFVGTPGYTSPEQADPSGQGVDTRTDVYSLGVVLYVLLTGVEPFDDGTGRKRPLLERLRQLREADPPSPSEKLNSDRKTLISSADSRGIAPNQLRSLLHGDLDWIGMKALEKDRERRYGTPMELAADIERHLHGRPVHAAPPSFTYRAGKFIRRNRLALGSAAVIVLVLVAASIISIRQSIRASREAAVAQAVSDFLQHDLLAQAGASGQSGPGTKPDPDLKVRTALDRAAQRINGKFAGQPAIEVAIRTTMGRTYEDLGLYPQAQEQLKKAAEDGRRTLGMDDDLTLIALHDLGSLLLEQGKYKEAETIDAEVLSARRRVSGPKDPKTLACMNDLATVYRDEGKYAQAEALHLQALEIFKRILGPEDPATLSSMSNLALIYSDEGRLAEAEKLDLQTLEIRKRVLGPEHPYTLTSMSNLGIVYSGEGKFAEAEKLDAEILDIRKRVLGPEHPYTLNSMNNLAEDYSDQGEYAQAEALGAQALEIRKRVQGPEHPATLEAMATLARDFYKQGKYAQAEPLFDELLKIQRRILGLESPDAAATIYSMGCMEARRGDKDKAIAQLRQSVDHGLAPYLDLGMQKDSDLVSLYGDPRFISLFAHARQVAAAKTARTQAPH